MSEETKLLQISARKQLSSGDYFRLRKIGINEYHWSDRNLDMNSFIVPDGHELVVRRNGDFIDILRRKL